MKSAGGVFALLGAVLCTAFVAGCISWGSLPPVIFEPSPRQISTGSEPSISVRDTGDIYLLKVEKQNLWYERSVDGGDEFGHPVRVNDVEGEVAAHAEAGPRLCLRGGQPYALWATRAGDSMRLHFARSLSYGESFTKSVEVDPSGAASQSFFNMSVSPKGTIVVVWLDGRDAGAVGAAVYVARSRDRGASFEPSVRVASGSCPCCRPSLSFTGQDAVHIGFRKIYDNNVRDIAIASSSDGGATWGEPVHVAEDNWHINGCPHSGPSLASIGNRLFVSWFTVHENEQQALLLLARSDDGGRTFSTPEWLSQGTVDANHPEIIAANGRILAVFQARDPNAAAGWGKLRAYVREVSADGRLFPLVAIGSSDGSVRYPRVAFESPRHVFLAWSESSDMGGNILLARGRLPAKNE